MTAFDWILVGAVIILGLAFSFVVWFIWRYETWLLEEEEAEARRRWRER
jgi:hypothetical protein